MEEGRRYAKGAMKRREIWDAMRKMPIDEVPPGGVNSWLLTAAVDMVYEAGVEARAAVDEVAERMGLSISHDERGALARSVIQHVEQIEDYAQVNPEKVRWQLAMRVTRWWPVRGE